MCLGTVIWDPETKLEAISKLEKVFATYTRYEGSVICKEFIKPNKQKLICSHTPEHT